VKLADDAEDAQVLNAPNRGHLRLDKLRRVLERAQIVAVEFDRKLAFDAGDGLFHVVGDGLRVIPDDAGKPLELLIDRGHERVLVLTEDRTPLVFGFQIDKVLGVEEAGGICAVVRTARLAYDLRDLWEGSHHDAGLVGEVDACSGAFTGRQRSAYPDGAFVEVGQKLRADRSAKGEIDSAGKQRDGDA